jgi:hypothetical protein
MYLHMKITCNKEHLDVYIITKFYMNVHEYVLTYIYIYIDLYIHVYVDI